ncbi:hypothetical protein GF380_02815 [Candidatus Uhrbacteria bacterium]|nr:hypothetical protein [Candidatus Uhrbacteria bacterium]MBD3284083.1 hypothetical protein [Candidatus Uhrbacteria bacterium]
MGTGKRFFHSTIYPVGMIKQLFTNLLAASAKRAIRRDKPFIIAITGSYGKSSTKEAIAIALGTREAGSGVRATRKNYNNEFGVPFTVLNVPAPGKDPLKWLRILLRAVWVGWGFGHVNARMLVLEMGADRPGDLNWLVRMAPPDISVITAVAEAHSEFFGTLDDVAVEKATLVRRLKKGGVVVLNNDDPRVTAMRKETECEAHYFGFSEGSDVRVVTTEPSVITDAHGHFLPQGIQLRLEIDEREERVLLKGTIGRPQAASAAAALALAKQLHVPVRQAIERLEKDYHGIAGRTRVIPGIKYTTIIDDTYNAASPATVISAICDLAALPLLGTQRKIAVIGEMRELGEYSEEAHRAVGLEVAAKGIAYLVTVGEGGRLIAAAAREGGMDTMQIKEFDTSPEAGIYLQGYIQTGDVLLAKGSQGSRMEKVVKELMAEPLEAPFLLVRMDDEWQRMG